MSDEAYSGKKCVKTTRAYDKRPKKSQKRPQTRHELEAPSEVNVNATAKKLNQSKDMIDIDMNPAFG